MTSDLVHATLNCSWSRKGKPMALPAAKGLGLLFSCVRAEASLFWTWMEETWALMTPGSVENWRDLIMRGKKWLLWCKETCPNYPPFSQGATENSSSWCRSTFMSMVKGFLDLRLLHSGSVLKVQDLSWELRQVGKGTCSQEEERRRPLGAFCWALQPLRLLTFQLSIQSQVGWRWVVWPPI